MTRHKVTFFRNKDRFYTEAWCGAYFSDKEDADNFVNDLLWGFRRAGYGFDIDLDTVQVTSVSN